MRTLVRSGAVAAAAVLLGLALVGWWALMPFIAGRQ